MLGCGNQRRGGVCWKGGQETRWGPAPLIQVKARDVKGLRSRAKVNLVTDSIWKETTGKSQGGPPFGTLLWETVNTEGGAVVRVGGSLGLDTWAGLCSRKWDI